VSREIQELEGILNGIAESQSSVRQQYGRDMVRSLDALKMLQSAPKQKEESIFPTELPAKISRAQHTVHEQFQQLCKSFGGGDPRGFGYSLKKIINEPTTANTRRHKYSQVPSRHHVEVRVVAGRLDSIRLPVTRFVVKRDGKRVIPMTH